MKTAQSGFNLIEILIVMVIVALLATLTYPTYQAYIKKTDLHVAHAVLMQNGQFMERFYQQKGSFKKTSTSWPELPVIATEKFCIRPNNNARGAHDGKFTLKAVAFNSQNEPRVLKIDESLTTFICESSASSCNNDDAFFKGSDKNCRIYQP
ncbi:type IV pilin protein [Neisseria sp. CCUG17229]|uniref:type IV pilin protein n=1 Tax=Neisseria sp. CCUG17229 TaxID=3392036 RepID=UPI003A0FCFAE